MLTGADYLFIALASVGAGFVNAVAGGGTLITFPVLTAVGVPAVPANVTNTVALCPGFFGAAVAQRAALRDQTRRLWITIPVGVAGGIVGGMLLLATDEETFRGIIPVLLLVAALLLAAQDHLRAWLVRWKWHHVSGRMSDARVALPLFFGAVYGGYFGAGLGVMMLAMFGLLLDDSLTRLNALKTVVALVINVAAAIFFMFSDEVVWPVAAVMAAGALVGGAAGGRLASRIRPETLRWVVVSIGLVAAVIYFVK
jgi:uncharacterized membrane protein YfcA